MSAKLSELLGDQFNDPSSREAFFNVQEKTM